MHSRNSVAKPTTSLKKGSIEHLLFELAISFCRLWSHTSHGHAFERQASYKMNGNERADMLVAAP